MDKDTILQAVEKYSQEKSILGTFPKVIGSDPGGQTTSVLMTFTKVEAATAEDAYALYLLDNANTDRSLYYARTTDDGVVTKPNIVVGDDQTVGQKASWQDIEYVQTHLASEGVHIPSETVAGDTLTQDDILSAYSIGDATAMTIVVEIQAAFIVLDWVTFA
jgi:hypothetical protein